MKNREIIKTVRGQRAVDGAGVSLVRVLSNRDVYDFDPFLMLDFFDSTDPADYLAGFPMHPHRGIETITYLISGEIAHEDSLGNKGTIGPGESQWMTAGSGILHQEMPQASGRMLGFQLWLNLPRAEKLTEPTYLSITPDMIPLVEQGGAEIRVLSGSFAGAQGTKPQHIPAMILDVSLPAGGSISLPTVPEETVFTFSMEGASVVNGQSIPANTALLFGMGEAVFVSAAEEPLRFIFYSGMALHEPIAWGGPIVMNTQEELEQAFGELRHGGFIRHKGVI